ncbi:MAG: hypothetical protein WCQ80_00620 [Bacilli bacterium]
MKIYHQFHGEIAISDIGKELRQIVKRESIAFKVLTGYGSTTGSCQSKNAVLRSLSKMQKEGLVKGYLPGEVKTQVLMSHCRYYVTKMRYQSILKTDPDYGNDGIIFVFIK